MRIRSGASSDHMQNLYPTHDKDGPPNSNFYFFKVMIGDFAKQLRIPPAFVKRIENKDSTNVILEGPSKKLWNLTLERNIRGMFFQEGWRKFVKDHSIQVGEFLVFRYNGDLHFTVQIFDKSACEKEYTLPIKNDEETISYEEIEGGVTMGPPTPKKNGKGRPRKTHTSLPNQTNSNSITPPDENGDGSICEEIQRQEGVTMGPTPKKNVKGQPRKKPASLPSQINSNSIKIKKTSHGSEKDNLKMTEYFESSRRAVTEEEKARAYEAAGSFKSRKPHFRIVMRCAHVYKGFFMHIPVNLTTYLPQESRNISLRIPGGQTWQVRHIHKGVRCFLSGGWRAFSLKNNLEEGDVCVFERVGPDFNFDVHIFRVVDNPSGKTKFFLCKADKGQIKCTSCKRNAKWEAVD